MRPVRVLSPALLLPLLAGGAFASPGPGEQGGMLSPNLWVFLIQAANYLVFIALMDRVLFRPVLAHLDARRSLGSDAEAKAEEAAGKAGQVTAARQAALDAALREALQERGKVKAAAVDGYQRAVHHARVAADAEVQAAKDKLQAEAEQAVVELQVEVDQLADLLEERLVRVDLAPGAGKGGP